MNDLSELSEGASRAVAEVVETRNTFTNKDGSSSERVIVKFKLHDKKGALELLGKHLGMFSDKYEDNRNQIFINGDDPQAVIDKIFATMSARGGVDGSSNGHALTDGIPEDEGRPEAGTGGSG